MKKKIFKSKSIMEIYSMAVGKQYLNKSDNENLGLCWTGGFHLLQKHNYITGQIKKLDRHRERQIAIVKARLTSHSVPSSESIERRRAADRHDYYGHPFSYYSAFLKKKAE